MVALWCEIIFYFLWISIHFRPRTRIANPLPQWALSGITAHSNKGDAKHQTGPGDKLPTLSWETIIKKQGILFHANVEQRKCMYVSIYHTENIPCSHISWWLQHLPEVSYAVALYHWELRDREGKMGEHSKGFPSQPLKKKQQAHAVLIP